MRENIAKLDTLTLQIYVFLSRTMYYIIIYAYDVIVDFCFKKKNRKEKKKLNGAYLVFSVRRYRGINFNVFQHIF